MVKSKVISNTLYIALSYNPDEGGWYVEGEAHKKDELMPSDIILEVIFPGRPDTKTVKVEIK